MVKKKADQSRQVSMISVGEEKFVINDIQPGLVYRVSPALFKGVRESVRREVITIDLAGIIIGGHELIQQKEIPEQFHTQSIREDIVEGGEWHDKNSQKIYLKETRSYWEERYSWDELAWMENFIETIYEFEGKVGDEWIMLFEIVRGKIPADFPKGVCFAIMIENVLERKLAKYTNRLMKEYFEEYPESIEAILSMNVPSNLPIWSEMGIEARDFIKYAHSLADERGMLLRKGT